MSFILIVRRATISSKHVLLPSSREFQGIIYHASDGIMMNDDPILVLSRFIPVCSGSVVVTAYDFESGRPGSNPDGD